MPNVLLLVVLMIVAVVFAVVFGGAGILFAVLGVGLIIFPFALMAWGVWLLLQGKTAAGAAALIIGVLVAVFAVIFGLLFLAIGLS